MSNMKKMLFTNWHIMRVIRLVFAIGSSYDVIATEQYFFLLFALFFLLQAIYNTGCGPQGCEVPQKEGSDS